MGQWEYLVRLIDSRRLYLELHNRVTLRTTTYLTDTIERSHVDLDRRWTLSGVPVSGTPPVGPTPTTNKYLTTLIPHLRMRAVYDSRYVWRATGWVRNIDGSYTLQSIDVHSVGIHGCTKGLKQTR